MARPWDSTDVSGLVQTEAGNIYVKPTSADHIYFDAAWSNHLPANKPEGEHGSTVLDIGRGVRVRATGHINLSDLTDEWVLDRRYTTMKQYPTGREVTPAQFNRGVEIIESAIREWSVANPDALVVAERVERNNAAQGLEQQIEKHEQALEILRGELSKCVGGLPYTEFPDLPTKRR